MPLLKWCLRNNDTYATFKNLVSFSTWFVRKTDLSRARQIPGDAEFSGTFWSFVIHTIRSGVYFNKLEPPTEPAKVDRGDLYTLGK